MFPRVVYSVSSPRFGGGPVYEKSGFGNVLQEGEKASCAFFSVPMR